MHWQCVMISELHGIEMANFSMGNVCLVNIKLIKQVFKIHLNVV